MRIFIVKLRPLVFLVFAGSEWIVADPEVTWFWGNFRIAGGTSKTRNSRQAVLPLETVSGSTDKGQNSKT